LAQRIVPFLGATMLQRGRRNADNILVMLLGCGATWEAAAQKAGVSKPTIQRRMKAPNFCRRLQGLWQRISPLIQLLERKEAHDVLSLVACAHSKRRVAMNRGALFLKAAAGDVVRTL
jgi:hypothetical protein